MFAKDAHTCLISSDGFKIRRFEWTPNYGMYGYPIYLETAEV